jgi:hypothetical protein
VYAFLVFPSRVVCRVHSNLVLLVLVTKLGQGSSSCNGRGRAPVASSFERFNELTGSVKGCKFFNQLSECQILKQDSAVWS